MEYGMLFRVTVRAENYQETSLDDLPLFVGTTEVFAKNQNGTIWFFRFFRFLLDSIEKHQDNLDAATFDHLTHQNHFQFSILHASTKSILRLLRLSTTIRGANQVECSSLELRCLATLVDRHWAFLKDSEATATISPTMLLALLNMVNGSKRNLGSLIADVCYRQKNSLDPGLFRNLSGSKAQAHFGSRVETSVKLLLATKEILGHHTDFTEHYNSLETFCVGQIAKHVYVDGNIGFFDAELQLKLGSDLVEKIENFRPLVLDHLDGKPLKLTVSGGAGFLLEQGGNGEYLLNKDGTWMKDRVLTWFIAKKISENGSYWAVGRGRRTFYTCRATPETELIPPKSGWRAEVDRFENNLVVEPIYEL